MHVYTPKFNIELISIIKVCNNKVLSVSVSVEQNFKAIKEIDESSKY